MLTNLPILEEDIFEVASFASDFENQIPAASKALLDNCTSLLASKLHTADDFAKFAREASKDAGRAPLAIKLLAGINNCAKGPHLDTVSMAGTGSKGEKADQDRCCNENKVKEGDSVSTSSVERLASEENKPVCSNCKVLKRKCLSGQEVRYIRPQSEQVFC